MGRRETIDHKNSELVRFQCSMGTKEHEDSEMVRNQLEGGEQKTTKTVNSYDSNGKAGNKRIRRQ